MNEWGFLRLSHCTSDDTSIELAMVRAMKGNRPPFGNAELNRGRRWREPCQATHANYLLFIQKGIHNEDH